MITLEERHKKIIDAILQQYPYTFYAYGSRAKNTARRLSDLDLCTKDAISERDLCSILAAFEESDLPITVDVLVWSKCSDRFKEMIAKDLVLFYTPQ